MAGLGLPEPPPELSVQVRDLGELRAGTRPQTFALRGLGWFAAEAFQKDQTPSYVLAGIEEVATGLHALHYLCCYGRLFVGVQVRAEPQPGVGWKIDATPTDWDDLAELQQLVLRAAAEDLLGTTGRIIAVADMFHNRSWRFTGEPAAGGGDGLTGARRFLLAKLG